MEATNQPSEQVLTALEGELRQHGIRLKPGQTIEAIVNGFASQGLTLEIQHGRLEGTINGGPARIGDCVESFVTKNPTWFYPRNESDLAGVTAKDQLDRAARMKYLQTYGLEAFTKLPMKSADAKPTVIGPRMTREQYATLDLKEKSAFISEFGPDAVAKVMANRGKK